MVQYSLITNCTVPQQYHQLYCTECYHHDHQSTIHKGLSFLSVIPFFDLLATFPACRSLRGYVLYVFTRRPHPFHCSNCNVNGLQSVSQTVRQPLSQSPDIKRDTKQYSYCCRQYWHSHVRQRKNPRARHCTRTLLRSRSRVPASSRSVALFALAFDATRARSRRNRRAGSTGGRSRSRVQARQRHGSCETRKHGTTEGIATKRAGGKVQTTMAVAA